MKTLILIIIAFTLPLQVQAEDLSKAGKACLHKEVNLPICQNAQAFIKRVESTSKEYLQENGLESSAAVVAFTVDTLSKGHVSIPQVLPWYKNSLNLSNQSVHFQMTIPLNF